MRPVPTLLAILTILALAGGGIVLMIKFMPKAEKEKRQKVVVGIEVMEIRSGDIQLKIPSQGLVRPVLETVATSEVAGQVKSVASNFEEGANFKKGDELVVLDDTDYQAALAKALAEKASAELDLELEKSRQEQAMRDWKELGGGREQSDLAKRIPQIAAATARLDAATKAVEKAEKDIERTRLVALYDGRVRSAAVDIGTYVTPGSRLGELYGTANYEVRLPVALDDFAFVDLNAPGEVVTLKTEVGGQERGWKGTILRTEGQIDRASRSVNLVVGLKGNNAGFTRDDLLAPNLFVEAEISGVTLKNVVKVPRKAFVETGKVLVYDGNDRVHFRDVKVVHETPDEFYVSEGLKDGEKICVTALAAVVDSEEGMQVRIIGSEEEKATNPPEVVPAPETAGVGGVKP